VPTRWFVVLAALALAAPAPAIAQVAPAYHFVDLTPGGFGVANGASAGQQVGFIWTGAFPSSRVHASLWTGSAASRIDLHPTGFDTSIAYSTSGAQQVGSAQGPGTFAAGHALLWSGSAASVIDLNPPGYRDSEALSVAGGRQLGYGYLNASGQYHALLWTGTASSAVDLHPAGFNLSFGQSTDGVQQVGVAFGAAGGGLGQAILWTGSAGSAINLTPAGWISSHALDVSSGQQVGFVSDVNTIDHAALWTGSAGSFVDLNPAGAIESAASGTNGRIQVGHVNGIQAAAWAGTPDSFVDLEQYVPSPFIASFATDVGDDGVIVGVAQNAAREQHAVMWVPVPEPTAGLFLLLFPGLLLRRRHRV
jgi:hypothetical protein